jgi:hypothetical protein
VTSATDSSRRNTPHPLDELEQAPDRLRQCLPWDMPQHAAFPMVVQSFCITPIQAALNDFWGLSRHLSRLDKPQKSLNTIRDRGDAEAQSVLTSQTANHKTPEPKRPTEPTGQNDANMT